ncbi:MAG: low specificity L-threonine aldolase [Isosphaera sp.]|nr:low specificity L-threonine aldolase [Isosphaera sp.]
MAHTNGAHAAPPEIIDFRSDTVTRPTPAMRRAIADAEVGDDVLGDDPTVIRLQERVAEVLGKPAAVYVPSGTMANQCAIRAHTEPGDEVLCHKDSHIIHYESGAPAALSSVMIRPLEGPLGLFDAPDVHAAVRPRSHHFACSRLLLAENTHNRGGGAVWPLEQLRRVADAARHHQLATHLDGARVWNASAVTGIAPETYAQPFDTVSCCFSKGLGAPVGSALAGPKDLIARAHRFRKLFGGTMRQAGVLAAAALYALDHHRQRLTEDHQNAKLLEAGLADIPGVTIAMPVVTNMVFIDLAPSLGTAQQACDLLRPMNVWALPNLPQRIRFVTHLDVPRPSIERAVPIIRAALGAKAPTRVLVGG